MTPCCIIAEAGVNHNGQRELALKLIDAAADAGADIVKFQTFNAEALASKSAAKATYQKSTTDVAESQTDMLRRLELSLEDHHALIERCHMRGVQFLSTPFDMTSISLLAALGMDTFKIPSGEITNLPYLRRIGGLDKKIILSTGMSTLDEVSDALKILESEGTPGSRIILLHCTTEYPAPMDSVNLRAMLTLHQAFPGIAGVGYSDHTKGIEIPIAAVAMGACVVEKHFTLDNTMDGPDHQASIEPHDLASMVRAIRNVETALGSGDKTPADAELQNITVVRKSIVAVCSIAQGDIFTEKNLTVKRPGNGISPMRWDEIIGTRAKRDYEKDELL